MNDILIEDQYEYPDEWTNFTGEEPEQRGEHE